SEERFRILVECVKGYAILMVNAAGDIVAWNAGAERLFGHSVDVVGSSITRLIPGLEGDALHDSARRNSEERSALRAAGTSFPIELAITQLEPQGVFVAIVHDISERKHLEELTEARQRRADELRRKSDELEAENR